MPFSFGHPLFLLGTLSVAVPIYLHLYYRRTPVPRDFPSLRLIRLSMEALVRRLKLKNYLLLALRLLTLLFLTLALAKPFFGTQDGLIARSGAPSAFVVILDNSLSMGASHQGVSLFQNAKTKALEIIDQMGAYDKASVALLNDPGSLLFTQLTWDKNDLKEGVRSAPLSNAGTNLYSSLNAAVKMLLPVKSFKRSVYLITDLTRTSWKPLLDTVDLAAIDKGIDLVLIPIGDGAPANLSLSELSLGSPLVMRERVTDLWVTVANHSVKAVQTHLSLFVDGIKKQELAIEVDPKGQRRMKIPCVFSQEGLSHVRASLPTDALPQDDTRHLAVKVLPPQPILILKPPADRSGVANKEDLFLRFALNPLNRSEGATFLIESREPSEVTTPDLQKYLAVILVNQRELPDPLVKALVPYVYNGGNLIVFPGSRTDPAWYNTHLIDDLSGRHLLPARFFKRVGNAVAKSVAYQLTDLDVGHPAFKVFAGEGNGDPSRAQIYEFFQVQPHPTAMVLARMSHGLPAIVEERCGNGRVLALTVTADTAWSNWPLKPTFLPFLHQVMIGMLGKRALIAGSVLPGAPISLVIPDAAVKRVTLVPPQGGAQELPLRKEGEGMTHVSTTRTELLGFYRLAIESGEKSGVGPGGRREEAFTVNPPPDESNLERQELKKIPRFIPLKYRVGGSESLGEKVAVVREGRELAYPLLWALLLLLLAESWLANRPERRPGEVPAA